MIKYILSKFIKKTQIASVKKSTIHSSSKIEAGSNVSFSQFDRHSFCGYDCDIQFAKVGSFTSIGHGVVIGGARHPMEWVGMSPVFYKGRDSIKKKFARFELHPPSVTTIGHDVWIGRSAIVLPGVTIGNGAVIGAGSIVTKNVPSYAVVAGNPATLIRYRFSKELAFELEATQWWSLDDASLEYMSRYIKKPEYFLKEFNRLNLSAVRGQINRND